MKASKHAVHYLTLLYLSIPTANPCPFATRNDLGGDGGVQQEIIPNDEIHRRSLRRRLSDTPEARAKVQDIIDNRTRERERQEQAAGRRRSGGDGDGGSSVSDIYECTSCALNC